MSKANVETSQVESLVIHEVLECSPVDKDDSIGVVLTTHERVTYDTLTEQFIVDIGAGCWVEVWGKNRFKRAIDIASKCSV